MERKNVKAWTVAIATVVVGLTSCNIDMPNEEPSSFETMTLQKSDIEIPMKFSAKMKGQADVTISPQVSGQLMKICVIEGEQVHRGQTLFIIEPRAAQQEVTSAYANLQADNDNLQTAIAQANSAKLEYESNKNLFEKKIVSNYMLESSLNNYKQAQAAISQARASVTQAQAAVSRAKVNLGFCTIKSPVDGVIGAIPVFAGDQVTPMTHLTIVSGNTSMNAEFSIPETVLEMAVASGENVKIDEALKEFPDVSFVMKNGTEYPHKGRITSATGVVDAATGSVACKATFPNPDGNLFSGIQGTVVLPVEEKDVMVIPQNAVVRLQAKSLVYKVGPDSCATSVEVTTASMGSGKDVVVLTGLKVGDVIVTEGANNVTEGEKVLFNDAVKK